MNNKVTLRELRQQKNKTTSEVAAALGVSPRTVNQYEKGDRGFDMERAVNICKVLDITLDELAEAYINTHQYVPKDSQPKRRNNRKYL